MPHTELHALDARVRAEVYRTLAGTSRAPAPGELARALGIEPPEISASLARLAAAHALVLDPGSGAVLMAHPFSAVATDYPVVAGERTWWANCAWDALGIPALLERDTETRTPCPDCAEPLRIAVRDGRVEGEGVVHFLVPARHFWDDIGFT